VLTSRPGLGRWHGVYRHPRAASIKLEVDARCQGQKPTAVWFTRSTRRPAGCLPSWPKYDFLARATASDRYSCPAQSFARNLTGVALVVGRSRSRRMYSHFDHLRPKEAGEETPSCGCLEATRATRHPCTYYAVVRPRHRVAAWVAAESCSPGGPINCACHMAA